MNSSKFDQMFNFISQYKYEINKNVPDNLKCGKCRNILINAYCVPCGCSYCCECVNEMLNDGIEYCPGKTEDCKVELISNNLLDYKTNKAVSNVVIKCPEEMCLHECTIINMEEHVRICENKSVNCPFNNFGCDVKKIGKEMLNDHCQSANFNHCKIMIDIIDNLRNESDILKANNREFVENLKSKDEIIDKINEEIDLMKLEREIFKQEIDSLKQILERKCEDINDKIIKTDERINIEKNEQKQNFDNFNEILEMTTKELFKTINKEKQARLELVNDKTKSIKNLAIETNKKSEMMDSSINIMNKLIGSKLSLIDWSIDKFNETKRRDGCIQSGYFTGIVKQYKLKLSCYPNGISDNKGKCCSIYLDIYSGGNDQSLSWPFSADVTINVINKTSPIINKNVTKYCKIDKPINTLFNRSDPFNFLNFDLKLENSVIVECFICFK